jgi:microsomal dipeptidase-like Zn-dependent dipeptidase
MGIEHVGLGADFVDQLPPSEEAKSRLTVDGFTTPEDFPALVTALRGRGYDGDRLEAITSANWLRILREALPP